MNDDEEPGPKIVPLHKPKAADDMVKGLRRIADELEKGEYGLITTCAVVLGHSDEKSDGEEMAVQGMTIEVFGLGPRHDPFTVNGLLLMAATKDYG